MIKNFHFQDQPAWWSLHWRRGAWPSSCLSLQVAIVWRDSNNQFETFNFKKITWGQTPWGLIMVVDHDLSKISQNLQKHIVQRRKWKADGHACVGGSKIFAGTRWSHWSYQVISTFSLLFFFRIFHSWWSHQSYWVISTCYFIPSYLLWFQCWNRGSPKWSCHPRWSQLECLGSWSSNFKVLWWVKFVTAVKIQMIWLLPQIHRSSSDPDDLTYDPQGGLGLWPGPIIDAHFRERGRQVR